MQDDPENAVYPTPLNAHKKYEVFVGRIRKDLSEENALNLWITADNLFKKEQQPMLSKLLNIL